MRPSLTPINLVRFTLAGSALMLLSSVASFLPFITHSLVSPWGECSLRQFLWGDRYLFAIVFFPFLAGWILTWRTSSRLRKGLRTGIWGYDQLEPARQLVETSSFRYLQSLAVLAFVTLGFYDLIHRGKSGLAWGFILAFSPVTSLRITLRQSPQSETGGTWREIEPLHSDHWGHPTA